MQSQWQKLRKCFFLAGCHHPAGWHLDSRSCPRRRKSRSRNYSCCVPFSASCAETASASVSVKPLSKKSMVPAINEGFMLIFLYSTHRGVMGCKAGSYVACTDAAVCMEGSGLGKTSATQHQEMTYQTDGFTLRQWLVPYVWLRFC